MLSRALSSRWSSHAYSIALRESKPNVNSLTHKMAALSGSKHLKILNKLIRSEKEHDSSQAFPYIAQLLDMFRFE